MSFPSFNWKLCLCYLVVPRLLNLNYVLEFKEDTFCFYSLRHLSVVIAPCSKKCQKFTLYVPAQPGMLEQLRLGNVHSSLGILFHTKGVLLLSGGLHVFLFVFFSWYLLDLMLKLFET